MTQDEQMMLEKGRVPMHVVLEAMKEYRRESDRSLSLDIEVISEKAHVPYDTLETWVMKPEHSRSVGFDAADRILCACGLWNLWYSRFNEYYVNINLRWVKCAAPSCEVMFEQGRASRGPNVKRYCSKSCADTTTRIERGEQQTQRKNYGSNGAPRKGNKCRNNHERTPETTKVRKGGRIECLLCHRASAKRYYEKKMGRAA